jgi:hypothetical protein
MTFKLLQSIDISDGSTIRRIAPCEGELMAIPEERLNGRGYIGYGQ